MTAGMNGKISPSERAVLDTSRPRPIDATASRNTAISTTGRRAPCFGTS